MGYIDRTVQYYVDNGQEYAHKRKHTSTDSVPLLEEFSKLVFGKKVLEIGFGLGFDAFWFLRNDYIYTGVDPVEFFCQRLSKKFPQATIINQDVCQSDFEPNNFDGIWAMASLLHLKNGDLTTALNNCHLWLKNKGVLFAAFKEGAGSETGTDGRFFNYMNRAKLAALISGKFEFVQEPTIEPPKSYNRGSQNWINFFLRKI